MGPRRRTGFRNNLMSPLHPQAHPVVTNKHRTMAELQRFLHDPFPLMVMKEQGQSTVRVYKELTNAAVINAH